MGGFVGTHPGKRMQLPRHIWPFVSASRTRSESVMSWHKSQSPQVLQNAESRIEPWLRRNNRKGRNNCQRNI